MSYQRLGLWKTLKMLVSIAKTSKCFSPSFGCREQASEEIAVLTALQHNVG